MKSIVSRHLKKYLNQSRQMHLLKNLAFVNNEWISAKSKAMFPVENPANDAVITQVPDMAESDAVDAIKAAHDAFMTWRHFTAKERSKLLRKWYYLCRENSNHLAEIITAEAGKPIEEAKGEIIYGNSYLEWFADATRHINGEIIPSPWLDKQILHTIHPLGVVSIITPWNFPYAMITRKVGALLAAGCTCVIKPSEETPLTALAAVALAEKVGIPKGIINVITVGKKNAIEVGRVLCQDKRIACISFTGSTFVGKILYGHAAKGVKRVALELGGNAPFIVFPSADIKYSVEQALHAKFRNNGQTCVGANRFLVHGDVHDEFVEMFKKSIEQKLKLGPGTQAGVTNGPLINNSQVQNIEKLVNDAVKAGAKIVTGGNVDTAIGKKFYKPTLLVNIKRDMTIFKEEIFGPVAQVYKIKSEEEAVEIANDNSCCLASYVMTRELGQAFRMIKNLEYGMLSINDGALSTTEAAFGGNKEAGIGREGGLHGALEYTDTKYTLLSGLNQ